MDSPKRLDYSEDLVVEYLKTHPDFFRDHPALLRELPIPHDVGAGVASLIERQVAQLRGHCAHLQQDLDLRRTRAGIQRTMLHGVQGAALKVLRGKDADAAYAAVARCLRQDYAADEFRVFVFRDETQAASGEGIRYLPRSAKLKYLFIELLNRNKPLCGSLQEEHIRMLFQAADDHVNSTLVVPLRHPDWEGLIAVGSREHGRYGRGFELDMIQHLLAVFGMRLDDLMRGATA